MVFTPFILLVAVGMLIWLVTQWPGRPATEGALEVARTRVAAGELTAEQFETIRSTLGAPVASPTAARGFVVLAVLLTALFFLSMSVWTVAWTARGGDWDWSPGHMGRMMRWDRAATGAALRTDDAEVAVQIRDFDYAPRTLDIRAGTRVTWTNADAVPHTATDRSRRWDTGVLSGAASMAVTFATAGTYPYYCTIHPAMSGTVVVRP